MVVASYGTCAGAGAGGCGVMVVVVVVVVVGGSTTLWWRERAWAKANDQVYVLLDVSSPRGLVLTTCMCISLTLALPFIAYTSLCNWDASRCPAVIALCDRHHSVCR